MNFDSTKQCVDNLSKKQTVTLDDILNMIGCVLGDSLEHNKSDYITEFKVEEFEKTIRGLNRFSVVISSLYKEHKASFTSETEKLKQRAESAEQELKAVLTEISSINEELECDDKRRQELTVKLAELEKTRGHLLPLKDECDRLDKDISRLNDPFLDRLAEVVEGKRKEAAERKQKEQDLTLEFGKREKELEEINATIAEISTDITKKQSEIDFAKASKEELERQQATIDKLWNNSKKCASPELMNVQTKAKVLMNAWESYKPGKDFDNIKKAKFSNIKLDNNVFSNVKSVQDIDNAINELIGVAEEATETVIDIYKSIQTASEAPVEEKTESDDCTGGKNDE